MAGPLFALDFVDDVGEAEPESSAHSACVCSRELCDLLGIRVKPSKEPLPAAVQKLLGVWLAHTGATLEVRPDEGRRQRMIAFIRLAGKLGFPQTSLFGSMGKACLVPIHARAAGGALQVNTGAEGCFDNQAQATGRAVGPPGAAT